MFSKYPDAARLLAEGKLRAEEGADFSPLYLLLNVAFAPGTLRWLQSLSGAVALVAVYLLARALFGRPAAAISSTLFGFAVPVLLNEATLEPDVWVMALNAGAIALLVNGSRFPLRFHLGAGAALGLSIAARPSTLLFLILALGWSYGMRRKQAAARAWLAPMILAAAAFALSLVPALALRAVVGQSLGATMSAGAVLHHGNRPEGTGVGAQPPLLIKLLELQLRSADNPDPVHALYRRFARAEANADLSAAQTEQFWIRKVVAFATREPLTFAGLLIRKLEFFVFGPDAHDLVDVRLAATRLDRMPLVSTQWLGLLGVVALGLLLAARRPAGLLGLYLSSTIALALGFYVVSRYRVATVPVWCALIGGLGGAALEAARSPRRLAIGGAVVAAAALVAWTSSTVADATRMLERGAAAGELSDALRQDRSTGALNAATRTFVRMQGAQPYVLLTRDLRGIPFETPAVAAASARYALETFGDRNSTDAFLAAVLRARAGECGQVLPELDRLAGAGFRAAIFDLSLDPSLLGAQCALAANDRDAARRWVARSLAARPGTLDALALSVAGGDDAKKDELFALHDLLSARFALAKARLAFADAAGALADADAVLLHLPEAAVVHHQRALALAALGRTTEAVAAYARALELFPAHAFEGRPLDAAVQARLSEAPDDPYVVSLAAEHRMRGGDIEAARALSERASALWGSSAPESQVALHRFLATARSPNSK